MKLMVLVFFILFSPLSFADNMDKSLPAKLRPLGDAPKGGTDGDWTERAQGIAHDENNWYISNIGMLFKIPKNVPFSTRKLKKTPGVMTFAIPQYLEEKGYDHMGDIDHYNGHIYIPLEGPLPHLILKVRAKDFKLVGTAVVPTKYQPMLPWLAIDPSTGLIYTSSFNLDSTSPINVFKENPNDPNFSIELVTRVRPKDRFGKNLDVENVQGGVFAGPFNQLLLASDTLDGGIMGFDTKNDFKLVSQTQVSYLPKGLTYEELEGIDYWAFYEHESKEFHGNVHLLMLDNDLFNDEVYLKHYMLED